MVSFTLVKNQRSGLYSVLENGVQIKNDIFIDQADFERELAVLGVDRDFQISVQDNTQQTGAVFVNGVQVAKTYSVDIGAESGIECEDCENEFHRSQLFPYKYEPGILLCDDCLAERMKED